VNFIQLGEWVFHVETDRRKFDSDVPVYKATLKFSSIVKAVSKGCPFCSLLCQIVNHFAVVPDMKTVLTNGDVDTFCSKGGILQIEFQAAHCKPLDSNSGALGRIKKAYFLNSRGSISMGVVEEVFEETLQLYGSSGLCTPKNLNRT
jgi:hypothetical protein